MPKCKDCGLLSTTKLNGEPDSAGLRSRETGETPHTHEPDPHCSVCSDSSGVARTDALYDNKAYFLAVINKQHDCPRHLPWQPPLTPREHIQMTFEQRKEEIERLRTRDNRIWAFIIAITGVVVGYILKR